MQTKVLAVLFLAGQVLCQSQTDKSQQSAAPVHNFDPQLLNYQLQQLALQQYSSQGQASQYTGQQQSQQPQYSQSVQYATQGEQYETQQALSGQSQQLSQQDYDAARLLQTKLFEPYQGQFANVQAQAGQYTLQQSAGQLPSQPAAQQLPKQKLLGVAYSSAADASKTSFTGYGIKYSF